MKLKIEIPITEQEAQELLDENCRFEWNFNGVDVVIYRSEEPDLESEE